MYDLQNNLEPGNPDGHTVLRYLIESKQMPLEVAIEQVYRTVNKFAQGYRSDQKKLLTGMVATSVLSLPVFFPFGISSLLIAGAIGASAFTWQELGAMRDRLKPEYAALKNSVLLEQFIKWLAQELKARRGNDLASDSSSFQSDALSTANIIAAYEHTVFAITNGEHLENNASDPVLALFVLKLRQHSNHLPEWVMGAFRQLEQAETQRSNDMNQASAYMWGQQEPRQHIPVGRPVNTLPITDAPAPIKEGEQRLGKPIEIDYEGGYAPNPEQINPSRLNEESIKRQLESTTTNGLEILHTLAATRRSTLLIGDTGAGKSVAQAYILCKLFELQPKTEAFVLTQKLDSFCGLAELGRVLLFDPTDPELALKLIGDIWKIYDERRRLPESERPKLPPVRLILADWVSINQALDDLKNEEPVKSSKYLTKLADIIYNGRELNVCLIIDLQSYNLLALGLKADRNSRKNFNLIGLGNYSIDELGMVNESYGVLSNLINDHHIVASESERLALVSKLKELQPISKATRRPIIFSGLSPAQLALLPDLRKYRSNSVKVSQQVATTVIESAPADIRERLEALIKATPKEKALPQSEMANKLLEIIQSATKQPISFESIRKSRKWEGSSPDKATLLTALNELTPDWIRGSEEEGYYLQD